MCLGVPGKIISIVDSGDALDRRGRVSFGGVVKEVSLAYVPEAAVDDFVIVHVGFAISRLDEAQAQETFAYLEQMGALEELDDTDVPVGATGGERS